MQKLVVLSLNLQLSAIAFSCKYNYFCDEATASGYIIRRINYELLNATTNPTAVEFCRNFDLS